MCACVLCACKSGPPIYRYHDLLAGEALAIGRITMLKTKHPEETKIFVKSNKQEMAESYLLNSGGYFCWKLKTGKYTIISFQLKNRHYGRIWVDFEIPGEKKYYYIGSLEIAPGVISRVKITDDLFLDTDNFKERFGIERQNLTTMLMTKEKL